MGLETSFAYNERGQIAATEVNGNATALTYDAMGNILSVTDAEGRTVAFEYDLNGNPVKTIYPDGTEDKTTYDALGRIVKVEPRSGVSTEYEYDALGRVIASSSGDRVARFEYDALGRLIRQTMPDGSEQTYAYDALGNLIGQTDPLGAVTAFQYDEESWLQKITYANGAAQELTYDLAGRVTATMDAEGARTRYAYDKVGRLTQVTDALGNRTGYRYNALDQVAQVRDALGHLTRYEYDARGNLTAETDALGNKTAYTYTPEGWLERIIKPNGVVITYAYDKTGQLLTQSAGDDERISHGYNEVGKLTVTETAEGKTEYQYNDNGYLISVKHPGGETLQYTYDALGRKDSLTYPDGKTVFYAYDEMDRLVKVTGLEGEVTTYAYDARGQRVLTESDGLTTTYAYDVMGNLVEQMTSGKSALELAYTYTPGGRIASEERIENSETILSQYVYDPLGQLTSFMKSDGYAEAYTYDAVGNMKRRTLQQGDSITRLTMQHNAANQMTGMSSPTGRIQYRYDRNGNLTSKTMGKLQDTYTYDAMDRLVGFIGYDGFEQQYMLDSFGLRTGMQQKGNPDRLTMEEMLQGKKLKEEAAAPDVDEWVKTSYIYDVTMPYGQMLTETTNAATTAYTYGLERIAAHNGTLKTQYVYDGRGSVAQTVASNNVQGFAYTPFGEMLGSKKTGFGFNAEWYDAATGMQNLRARQYEPAMMRFAQKDILRGWISSPLSLNRYMYVLNDPISYVDPSGAFAMSRTIQSGSFEITLTVRKAGKSYADPFEMIDVFSVFTGMSASEFVATMTNKEITALWNDYRNKQNTLTEEETRIIDSAIAEITRINKSKMSQRDKNAAILAVRRNACMALAAEREAIVSNQGNKGQETKDNIDAFSNSKIESGDPYVTSSAAVDSAEFILASQLYWYYYRGLGSRTLQEQLNHNLANPKKGEPTPEIPVHLLDKRAVDCIGLIAAIYRMNGLTSAKNQGFSSLGSTRNAFNNATATVEGANIRGNIYEIGTGNLVPGMLVYKYTQKGDNWILGHVGIYVGDGRVIDARGFDSGITETDIGEWHAYSWADGVVLR